MSDALRANGITITEGYGAEQLAVAPDLWVIGNAVSRGNPLWRPFSMPAFLILRARNG